VNVAVYAYAWRVRSDTSEVERTCKWKWQVEAR
jgi:hypothetical protein